MTESSVELPVKNVLAACEACHKEALARAQAVMDEKLFDEPRRSAHAVEILEIYCSPSVQNLMHLCRAALAAGENKLRVSSADFSEIFTKYEP